MNEETGFDYIRTLKKLYVLKEYGATLVKRRDMRASIAQVINFNFSESDYGLKDGFFDDLNRGFVEKYKNGLRKTVTDDKFARPEQWKFSSGENYSVKDYGELSKLDDLIDQEIKGTVFSFLKDGIVSKITETSSLKKEEISEIKYNPQWSLKGDTHIRVELKQGEQNKTINIMYNLKNEEKIGYKITINSMIGPWKSVPFYKSE